jgi:hypothetical protein
MLKSKLHILIVTLMLISLALGLGGCRREETKTNKQSLPLVGSENSPLPTPGVADSPVTP